MNIRSLSILSRDEDTELFNLIYTTFETRNDILENTIPEVYYTVRKDEEMRMDIVSQNLYGTDQYVDFLLSLNNIINPLSIKEGISIRYIPKSEIENFYPRDNQSNDVSKKLNRERNKTRVDEKRKKYLEEKAALPPTMKRRPTESVKYRDGRIIVGGDIFNN